MAPAEADKPLCFAIMPITTPADAIDRYGGDSDHFVHIAEFIFKPAAELAGYRFVPAAVDSSRVIQAAIIKNLAAADVVLCDTSLWNANVFFELGIRVALNKPVALVKDGLTETIPFDNTPVHCYEYDHRMDPWCTREEIPKLSEHIAATGKHQQNELWKFAGIQVTAQQSDAGSPEDAKLDLLLARVETLSRETSDIKRQATPQPRAGIPYTELAYRAPTELDIPVWNLRDRLHEVGKDVFSSASVSTPSGKGVIACFRADLSKDEYDEFLSIARKVLPRETIVVVGTPRDLWDTVIY